MTFSDKDQHLIALLRENARYPVAELARRMNASRTAVQVRLEKLERSGVIDGYTVKLSPSYLSGRVKALVMIKAPPSARASIERDLAKFPALTTLHSISGTFDLVAEISAGSVDELDGLIDDIGRLKGVVDTLSSVILSTKIDR